MRGALEMELKLRYDLLAVFPLSCARVRAHTAFRDCAYA